jgi:hypothetical protein
MNERRLGRLFDAGLLAALAGYLAGWWYFPRIMAAWTLASMLVTAAYVVFRWDR